MSPAASKLKLWDIYAKELCDLGFGYPLWVPEPSPECGEVQLGDVGYLRQGKFYFLFNCMRNADDPVNSKGVPAGFKVFVPPDGPAEESATTIPNHISRDLVLLSGNARLKRVETNASIGADPIAHAGSAISYSVEQKTGAWLALKRPAHQTSLPCTEAIFKYLRAHHARWRTYVKRRGLKLESQHILFVSGFHKTAAWAVGAFKHRSASATLKIDAGAMFGGGSASAGAAISTSDRSTPMSLHRRGPEERLPWDDDAPHSDNQCIFLQYAHLKPRLSILPRLGSAAVMFLSDTILTDESNEDTGGEKALDCFVDSERQYEHDGVRGPSQRTASEVKTFDGVSLRGSPGDVHQKIESVGLSRDTVSLSHHEEGCEVSDGGSSDDEVSRNRISLREHDIDTTASDDDSARDKDESDDYAVDEEALDYILEHCPEANFACASSQDLYTVRQARRAMNVSTDAAEKEMLPGLSPVVVRSIAFLGRTKKGSPDLRAQAALREWRHTVYTRDHRLVQYDEAAVLDDDLITTLVTTGPLSATQLRTLLQERWVFYDRHGEELVNHVLSLAVVFTPIPARPRGRKNGLPAPALTPMTTRSATKRRNHDLPGAHESAAKRPRVDAPLSDADTHDIPGPSHTSATHLRSTSSRNTLSERIRPGMRQRRGPDGGKL